MPKLKATVVRPARFNHGATVTAVVRSRDGSMLVTGGTDGRVRVWDAGTGLLRRVIAVHTSAITCLALSSDEGLLVSGDALGRAAVSDLDAGTTSEPGAVVSSGHGWALSAVAIARDGTIVFGAGSYQQRNDLYGDRDDPAQLRAFAGVEELHRLTRSNSHACGRLVHAFEDRAVVPRLFAEGDDVWVDDGKGHVLRARVPALEAWEPATAPPADHGASDAWASAAATGTAAIVAVARDVVACADGSIFRGEVATKVAFPPEAYVFAIGTAGEVVVGTKTGVLAVFEAGSVDPRLFDDIHPEGIRALAVTSDGRWVLTGGIDGHVRVWDLARRQLLARSTGDPPDAVHAIAGNDTNAFSADRAGNMVLWSLPSLEAPARFENPFKSFWGLTAVAIDRGGLHVALATMTEVVVCSTTTGAVETRRTAGFAVQALAFREDGSLVMLEAHQASKLCVFRAGKQVAGCLLAGNATVMDVGDEHVTVGFTDGQVLRVTPGG